MRNVALIILTLLLSFCSLCYGAPPFDRLQDTFGDWHVRHVYNNETFQYRFSDTRSKIRMDNGGTVRFDINRNSEGEFYYKAFGWIYQVIIEIDGRPFPSARLKPRQQLFHHLTQDVNGEFLNTLANTTQDVRVGLLVDDGMIWGTLSSKGSSAALRWIGAVK